MKYLMKLETFTESKLHDFSKYPPREQNLAYATTYLEENQPIRKEEGFIDCSWLKDDRLGIWIEFRFIRNISEETKKKIYKYLEKENLKIITAYFTTNFFFINVDISDYKIKKYSNIMKSIKNYNL